MHLRSHVSLVMALTAGAALSLGGLTQPAHAETAAPSVAPVTVSVQGTYENNVDYSRPIGSCSATGGTCTIARVNAIATTVQSALNVSTSIIAGQLGFSLSRTNSTSVSCTSPVLKAGQTWTAYAVGTYKLYTVSVNYPTGRQTSGVKGAWQPYSYPAISCS